MVWCRVSISIPKFAILLLSLRRHVGRVLQHERRWAAQHDTQIARDIPRRVRARYVAGLHLVQVPWTQVVALHCGRYAHNGSGSTARHPWKHSVHGADVASRVPEHGHCIEGHGEIEP